LTDRSMPSAVERIDATFVFRFALVVRR